VLECGEVKRDDGRNAAILPVLAGENLLEALAQHVDGGPMALPILLQPRASPVPLGGLDLQCP
jgi:hypothetical protein